MILPDGVLLEEVVGYLSGKKAVACLWLLRDKAFQHVLEWYSGTSDALFTNIKVCFSSFFTPMKTKLIFFSLDVSTYHILKKH